jgi:hypothetical protein
VENEPIRTTGYLAAAGAAFISALVVSLPISAGKKIFALAAVAVGTPLVAARVGREYVAPLGPNREQAGEGHPMEAMREEFTPDAGGGPDAQPAPPEATEDEF